MGQGPRKWTQINQGQLEGSFWGYFDFLKTLSWADFHLLESFFTYIHLHKNKKIYHRQFFSLDACSRPMWSGGTLKKHPVWTFQGLLMLMLMWTCQGLLNVDADVNMSRVVEYWCTYTTVETLWRQLASTPGFRIALRLADKTRKRLIFVWKMRAA